MLKLLGNFAKGVAKKKVKKKGAEMAKNITNKKEKDNSSAIVVREKSTTLSAPLLGGDTDSSANTPKKSRSRSPLDRINSSLKDIMKTLKKRRKLMLNKSRRMRVQADKEKKDKREGILESIKNTGKKMVKSAASAASGWWERLQTFLLMTLVGSLVVAIKENWEAIKVQIDKVVNIIKDIWEFMSPVLIPLFKALKWITVQGLKLIGKLLGMGKDKKQIEKGIDNVSEELKNIDKESGELTKQFEESEKNIKDITNTKEPNLDTKTELSSPEVEDTKKGEVEGKTPPPPKRNRDEVTTDKTIKGDLSTITFDGKTFPRGLSGPMETFGGKGGSTYPEKKYNVGGYVTRDGEVHEGEYVVKESIVKKVGVTSIENVIKTMMQTSTTNIKQNPLKVISIMEGMSKQFAPIGEQLPEMINETIKESKLGTVSKKITKEMIEKMENTLTVLKEQTDYEEQSGNTLIISAPKPSRPSVSGGGGGGTKVIPIGESGKTALNRYVNAVIQKTLY